MSYYDLPTAVELGGVEHSIRSDYRVALDCIQIMGDADLADDERTLLLFEVFYEDWEAIDPNFWQEALDRVFGLSEAVRANHAPRSQNSWTGSRISLLSRLP